MSRALSFVVGLGVMVALSTILLPMLQSPYPRESHTGKAPQSKTDRDRSSKDPANKPVRVSKQTLSPTLRTITPENEELDGLVVWPPRWKLTKRGDAKDTPQQFNKFIQAHSSNGTHRFAKMIGLSHYIDGVCVRHFPLLQVHVSHHVSGDNIPSRNTFTSLKAAPDTQPNPAAHNIDGACERFTFQRVSPSLLEKNKSIKVMCRVVERRPTLLVNRRETDINSLYDRFSLELHGAYRLTKILGVKDLSGVDLVFVDMNPVHADSHAIHHPFLTYLPLYQSFNFRSIRLQAIDSPVCYTKALMLSASWHWQEDEFKKLDHDPNLTEFIDYLAVGMGRIAPSLHPFNDGPFSILYVLKKEWEHIYNEDAIVEELRYLYPEDVIDVWADVDLTGRVASLSLKERNKYLLTNSMAVQQIKYISNYHVVITFNKPTFLTSSFLRKNATIVAVIEKGNDYHVPRSILGKLGINFQKFIFDEKTQDGWTFHINQGQYLRFIKENIDEAKRRYNDKPFS